MKKFCFHIILFLLPLGVVLFFLPTKNVLKYFGLKDDCIGHGIWMHDRIFENDKKIDVAFVGSSHTISAINDRLLENHFKEKKINITNLGYCRLGRNLSYIITKELLSKKQPKYLVVEVREKEDRYSHPIFPYMADTKEVIFPALLFNRDIFSDVATHFSYKIELTQDFLYNKKVEKESIILAKGDYGFGSTNDTVDLEILNDFKIERTSPKSKPSELERNFYMAFPRSYLKKISDLCHTNQVELYFLYLPSYGSPSSKPSEYDTYLQYGEVLFPPADILENPDYWYDPHHLNPAGANELSNWIKKEIENRFIFVK